MTFRLQMRFAGVVGLALTASLLAGCGGGSSSSSSNSTSTTPATEARSGEGESSSKQERSKAPAVVEVRGKGPKPKLHYPPRPPRHVVTRVLREGSGPVLKPGDRLAARYVGGGPKVKYFQDFWSEESPYRFQLGRNALGKAWVIGLSGMRLGGRRELIVPSRLAYGEGMMVYVIEPLVLEGRASGRRR